MNARRYEISLRVLKNISTLVEKFRIFKRPCSVPFIILTPVKYQTISLFAAKGAIYYATIGP